MRTPISYYGGKQALKHIILPLVPEHTNYTEAFFGGGTIFWAKKPAKNETINDKLDIVVNFYQVLKLRFKELKPLIDASLISRSLHKKALVIYRQHKKGIAQDAVQLAWAFWLLSNFSHSNKLGGGLKYSNKMDTVPPVTMQTKKREFTELLVYRIENASIENNDALYVLKTRDTVDTFHYIDPPYINANNGHYGGYTDEDFVSLCNLLPALKGKFILSHYPHPKITEITQIHGYNYQEKNIPIQAGTGNSRKNSIKTEILLWNYNLQPTLFSNAELMHHNI